ncbi:hypothetical protein BGW38_009346 [Lunasporangiospora selenospora]|uniref:BAG domain-containing protein n=1 Tax=Lunasporangiospora selenospora TaxID=979761 RepID=A0A9P6FZC2_9FUNG|nr:hypothetical protein BGW38_009346 [Lunasporangiospora selenospora]
MYPYYAYPFSSGPSAYRSTFTPLSGSSVAWATQVQPSLGRSSFVVDDGEDEDEEELLLRAALERKQRERASRRQRQYELLLQQERQRQHALAIVQAQAQAQAQDRAHAHARAQARARYETKQEAIRQYNQALRIQEQQARQAAALESFVVDNIFYQPRQRHQEYIEPTAYKHDGIEDDEHAEFDLSEPLNELLNAVFFPHQKRVRSFSDRYPCKRRQSDFEEKCAFKTGDDKTPQLKKRSEEKRTTKEAKSVADLLASVTATSASSAPSSCKKTREKASSSSKTEQQPQYTVYPDLGAFFETLLGGTDGNAVVNGCREQLRAQERTVQQKHSELNMIESTLDSFSQDLTQALAGVQLQEDQSDKIPLDGKSEDGLEEDRKQVLVAEEHVTKAMIEIDAVESDGDLSIRQRRKELIQKSQDMLELVDAFKKKKLNTGKSADRVESKYSEVNFGSSDSSSSSSFSESLVAKETDVEMTDDAAADPKEVDLSATDETNVQNDDNDDEVQPYTVTAPTSVDSVTVQEDEGAEDNDVEKESENKESGAKAVSGDESAPEDFEMIRA